jgi:NAD(P)-dependent dehydrogenase (short-subunit alcohol dehydrogenase family)
MENGSRTVLITGASTGIGNHLAIRLSGLGHTVFATARKQTDLDALGGISGVVPIPLDVRRPNEVRAAIQRIEAHGHGLYGLVNNAGLGGLGPVATWNEEEILEIFDVNAIAPIRLSQACLPLLLESGGRIVNIGSQGGTISKRYFGPYTMTKHALEAFTVALDEELAPYGVRVSIVQPGGVSTPMGANALPSMLGRFRRARPPFDREAEEIVTALTAPPDPEAEARGEAEAESEANRKPSSPEVVVVAVIDALFSPSPRLRYMVGTRWEGERMIRTLLDRLLDANECPALGDPVEKLVAQLRAHAEARSGGTASS